jgi:phosphoribosylanthranilate isomerase
MASASPFRPARTRIKICGIRDADAARAAVDAGADAVGFVFVDGSPRRIELDDAAEIAEQLPPFVAAVALLVDPSDEEVGRVMMASDRFTLQLHGHESRASIEHLRGRSIIKAVNFGDERQASWLDEPSPCNVRALLIDAPAKPQQALPGGGGEAFDWRALARLDRALLPPLILAGGLTAQNVEEAIATARPYAVDVSSGVESSRGVKDAEKIRAFCAAVRRADGRGG